MTRCVFNLKRSPDEINRTKRELNREPPRSRLVSREWRGVDRTRGKVRGRNSGERGRWRDGEKKDVLSASYVFREEILS